MSTRYLVLSPKDWVGKLLSEIQLTKYIPLEKFEGWEADTTLVIYRSSCEHCAKHLERLAKDKSGKVYILVRVPEAPGHKDVIKIKPEVPVEVTLPDGPDWTIQVPWEIVIDKNGRVEKATLIVE